MKCKWIDNCPKSIAGECIGKDCMYYERSGCSSPSSCFVSGWVEALVEANRHIEALAVVRKDNSWDMIDARAVRNRIADLFVTGQN